LQGQESSIVKRAWVGGRPGKIKFRNKSETVAITQVAFPVFHREQKIAGYWNIPLFQVYLLRSYVKPGLIWHRLGRSIEDTLEAKSFLPGKMDEVVGREIGVKDASDE
jgi:hypothetical protein